MAKFWSEKENFEKLPKFSYSSFFTKSTPSNNSYNNYLYISCEKENVVLSKIWYIRQLFFGDENNFNKCTSSNCCIAQSKSTLNEYKNDISKWRVGGNYVCT